jgi:hypothetical protein
MRFVLPFLLLLPLSVQAPDVHVRVSHEVKTGSEGTTERTAYYAESGSTGAGANPSARMRWSHQLNAAQAKPFLPAKFLRGRDRWNPEAEAAKLP